jgi:hypothetical protein
MADEPRGLTVGGRPIAELETFVGGLVPPDKKGVLVTMFDQTGARVGVALKDGDHFAASFEVRKAWESSSVEWTGKVQVTW